MQDDLGFHSRDLQKTDIHTKFKSVSDVLSDVDVDSSDQRAIAMNTFMAAFGENSIQLLVQALLHEADHDRHKAAGILQAIACEDEMLARIFAADAVIPLLQLVKCGSIGARTRAVTAIGNLAYRAQDAKTIGMLGAIPPLLQIVKDETLPDELRLAALEGLFNMSFEPTCAETMANEAIPAVVYILRNDGSQACRDVAAMMTTNLVHFRATILKTDAIPTFVHAFRLKGSEKLKFEMVQCLRVLVCYAETADVAVAAGAITVFFAAVTSKKFPTSLQLEALKGINNLCNEKRFEHHLAKAKVIPQLVAQLRGTSHEMQTYAMRALRKLTSTENNCRNIAKAGAIPLAVQLLAADDEMVQELAVLLLWDLQYIPSNLHELAQIKPVPALVRLVQTGTDVARVAAANVLVNLTRLDAQATAAINDGDVVPTLVQYLATRSANVQYAAAVGIYELLNAMDTERINAVVSAGALPALLDLIPVAVDYVLEAVLACLSKLLHSAQDLAAVLGGSGSNSSPSPLMHVLTQREILGEGRVGQGSCGVLRRLGVAATLPRLPECEEAEQLTRLFRELFRELDKRTV